MKKLAILLLVGIALLLGISPCNAEILQQATDVFEVSDDGQKMQIVTVLEEGTEYELIERVVTQAGSTFDSYYYSDVPIEWGRISFWDRNGYVRQGWIVMNPDVITGINMSVFDDDSSGEYNGYNSGFVLCESLSLREQPEGSSPLLDTLAYGTSCTILEESGSWYNVVYRSQEGIRYSGWVRKEYVLMNPTYFTPNEETPVYAMPSSGSKRVGLIDSGTSYPVIGLFDGFLVISLRGASGFVKTP